MNITKDTCILLRERLDAVLPDIAKELGITISVGNMRYDAESIAVTMTCAAIPDGVDANDPKSVAKAEFERYAKYFGGDPAWFGRKIRGHITEYTVVGIKTSARKNAFLIEDGRGKQYVCDANTIKNNLI